MNELLPVTRMRERIEIAKQDSDSALFFHLLYFGEFLLKLTTSAVIAAIDDEREKYRYRLVYSLVRSDGLGDWCASLHEALLGPPSQYLQDLFRNEQKSLSKKYGPGEWQYEAVSKLCTAIRYIEPSHDLPNRISLLKWFDDFVILRNKTRGHGAPSLEFYSAVCPLLEDSINLIINNLYILKRPWAYLRRNLSGKYRVFRLGGDISCFEYLKTADALSINFADGVYIQYNRHSFVDLFTTTSDLSDFFFPNGHFNGKTYELLSYITDSRANADASPYLTPVEDLPSSETVGLPDLDCIGKSLANLPPKHADYIPRPSLEEELYIALSDERHPVVTLVGRGGIGKTSLAIAVLHKLAFEGIFDIILWFSARDIELLPEGPKPVKPYVLTKEDIANEFVRLTEPRLARENKHIKLEYLANSLTKSPFSNNILFVFDNFETIRIPVDVFRWLDANIRLPNKILITTRQRDFRADFPIEVGGMQDDEANHLIDSVAEKLGIKSIITKNYRDSLIIESDAHPYVIKVLLGEVAKAGHQVKIERIVASKEDMLYALFERTYSNLSPAAKRVFLTLCGWRSLIPQVALEAVLLRPSNERMDVERAVQELVSCSFIDTFQSEDDATYLSVPFVTSIFGKKRSLIEPMSAAIKADLELLKAIGATQESGAYKAGYSRIVNLFKYIAKIVSNNTDCMDEYLPILRYICSQYPPAYLTLSQLFQELNIEDAPERAKESVRSLLMATDDKELQKMAWTALTDLCKRTQDWIGEIHASVELCKLPEQPYSLLSNAAYRLMGLMKHNYLVLDSDEKRIIVRELIDMMETRKSEATATDISRLAWLYLHLNDQDKARDYVIQGLELDPTNIHLLKLRERLGTKFS
ncbi:MAG: NB-ARC domain-containing protein [Actinomycetota bacterium]|nr:NB-ARC domain-containing protein [Actinomycetota bacterium]